MTKQILFFSFSFLSLLNVLSAQAGLIDSSFANNGVLELPNIYEAYDMIELADHSVIVGGLSFNSNEMPMMGFTKVSLDGEIITTFGNAGTVTTPDWESSALNMEIYDTERFLAYGNDIFYDSEGAKNGRLVRLFNNGDIDTTFGVQGSVEFINDDFEDYQFSGLEVLSDGKILVSYFGDVFYLMRFMPDGSIDTSFGLNGKKSYSFNFDSYNISYFDIKVFDNHIFTCGMVDKNDDFGIGILRINMDGSLDNLFGDNGVVFYVDNDFYQEGFNYFQILDNGKIHLSGTIGDDFDLFSAQFEPDGSYDTSYGIGGRSVVPLEAVENDIVTSCLQPDGKVLVAGISGSGQILARLNPNGSLDTLFADNGINILDDPSIEWQPINDVRFMSDLSIWAAGGLDYARITKYKSGLLVSNNDLAVSNLPINVFPNPLVKTFDLDFGLGSIQQVNIDLVTPSGKEIHHFLTSSFAKGSNHLTLEMPSVSAGSYLVRLQTKDGVLCKSVVVSSKE